MLENMISFCHSGIFYISVLVSLRNERYTLEHLVYVDTKCETRRVDYRIEARTNFEDSQRSKSSKTFDISSPRIIRKEQKNIVFISRLILPRYRHCVSFIKYKTIT